MGDAYLQVRTLKDTIARCPRYQLWTKTVGDLVAANALIFKEVMEEEDNNPPNVFLTRAGYSEDKISVGTKSATGEIDIIYTDLLNNITEDDFFALVGEINDWILQENQPLIVRSLTNTAMSITGEKEDAGEEREHTDMYGEPGLIQIKFSLSFGLGGE